MEVGTERFPQAVLQSLNLDDDLRVLPQRQNSVAQFRGSFRRVFIIPGGWEDVTQDLLGCREPMILETFLCLRERAALQQRRPNEHRKARSMKPLCREMINFHCEFLSGAEAMEKEVTSQSFDFVVDRVLQSSEILARDGPMQGVNSDTKPDCFLNRRAVLVAAQVPSSLLCGPFGFRQEELEIPRPCETQHINARLLPMKVCLGSPKRVRPYARAQYWQPRSDPHQSETRIPIPVCVAPFGDRRGLGEEFSRQWLVDENLSVGVVNALQQEDVAEEYPDRAARLVAVLQQLWRPGEPVPRFAISRRVAFGNTARTKFIEALRDPDVFIVLRDAAEVQREFRQIKLSEGR